MKKSILQFSVIAAIAASMTLTTSCSSDESVAEAYVPEPVQFSIGVGDLSVSRASSRTQASDTKVPADGTNFTVDNKWNANDILAIYTHDADKNWYLKAYKVNANSGSASEYNAVTATGTGASKDFYWGNTSEVKVFEVYSIGTSDPISNTAAADRISDAINKTNNGLQIFYDASHLFDVPSDQTTSNKEFLYNYGAMKYDNSVSADNTKKLKLRHQLTRIDVVVITPKSKAGTEKDKQVYIGNHDSEAGNAGRKISLKGHFVKPDGLIKSTEGMLYTWPTAENLDGLLDTPASGSDPEVYTSLSWTPSTASGDQGYITPRVISAETEITADLDENKGKYTTTYSAVVIPQNFKDKFLFDIEYDGARYVYTGQDTDDMSGSSGKHYTYKVVVGPTGLVVTASVSPWQTVDGYTPTSPKDVEAKLQ